MKKKLTDEIKYLNKLPLDQTAFDIPEIITIDFTTVHPIYAYEKSVRTTTVKRYTAKGVDDKVYHALKELGLNFSSMPQFDIDLRGNLDEIKKAKDLRKVVSVKLLSPKVTLQRIKAQTFVPRRGYKLVAKGLSFLPQATESEEYTHVS
ncbi:hypothetical protein FACS1894192_01330 [Bacilli bacterium]|nr:hypothetical protein FACS1894192_01330 [Bacilli bacterium]